jgi:hypothetical protein
VYTTNWTIFTILFLLMLYLGKDAFSGIWRTFLFWVHIASGSRLFQYVMLYAPDEDPSVPEEERDVVGIVFSNDEKYIDKISEVIEK